AYFITVRYDSDRVVAAEEGLFCYKQFSTLIEATPAPVLIHQHGTIVHANPEAVRLLGASSRADIVGLLAAEVLELHEGETATIETGDGSGVQHVTAADRHLYRLDGATLPVELTSFPSIWDGLPATQVIVRGLAERRQADLALMHLATHDTLTGLPNRSLLDDRLRHASARAQRTRRPFAVLFLDLDRFKVVNDT